MKRDIFNHLGVKVGELELPDGTAESIWQEKLAIFARPPTPVSMSEVVWRKLEFYETMAPKLIRELKVANTLAGITVEQSKQMFEDYRDIILMIREGAFPTAYFALSQKSPSGFVTQERLDEWKSMVAAYL